MKILVASVTNRSPEVIKPHIDSILGLEAPPETELSLAYISDSAPPETERLLAAAGARVAAASPKPADALYEVSEETHAWNLSTFAWLAAEKQRLLDLAVEEDYDAIFFVDSDLVLGPETLSSLLATEREIVSAVFWTSWQREAPPQPQVWLTHPYGFKGRSGNLLLEPHEFLRRLSHRELLEVGGLGACTLIRTSVLDRVRYAPLLDGLPSGGMWQGEDRSFCIRAARHHIPLWACAWSDIHHAYRPSDVRSYEECLAGWQTRKERAEWGDEVSVVLEPLEEPELAKRDWRLHLRGRVGALKLLPDVEKAILETSAGEERIIRVEFPTWWSLEHLRGTTKAVMLRVLDVKERR